MFYILKNCKMLVLTLICFIGVKSFIVLGEVGNNNIQTIHNEILVASRINHEGDYCYSYNLKYPCVPDSEKKSNLILYENKLKLGPAHSSHSRIRKKGEGMYSHWRSDTLYFSTSDNSDPRINGRKYSVETSHNITIYEEVVTTKLHQYQITVQGKKEPFNRYIKIENIGESNIVNPKLISDNVVDMSSIQSILNDVISDSMKDKEKAIKLWEFIRDNRYHWYPAEQTKELCDLIKYLNVYGYGYCDHSAMSLEVLWEKIGLNARCWDLNNQHVVSEVFYNNAWHMLDADHKIFYMKKDNKTIASVKELEEAHFLIIQQGDDPTGYSATLMAELYRRKNNSVEDNRYVIGHTMNIILRANESLIRCWEIGSKYHDNCYHKEPPIYANGKIVYIPNLTKVNCMEGIYKKSNIKFFAEDRKLPYIHTDIPNKVSCVIYKVASPYVIVGGEVGGKFKGRCKMYISFDEKNWTKIWDKEKAGDIEHYENIDLIVNNPRGGDYETADWDPDFNAKYSYFIKYEFFSDENDRAGLNKLAFCTDVQVAPKSLPSLKVGVNNICFTRDENNNKSKSQVVKITYAWEEN